MSLLPSNELDLLLQGLTLDSQSTQSEVHDLCSQPRFSHSFDSLEISSQDWADLDHVPSLKEDEPTTTRPSDDQTSESTNEERTPSATTSTSPGPVRFKFSPSVLAHHANTACEKMLHLKGHALWQESLGTTSKRAPDSGPPTGPKTLAEANMKRGIEYESRLQKDISLKIDCEQECDSDSYFRLSSTAEGTTLCQPIFSLDKSFYTPAMQKAGVVFGRFIPDFIRILPGSPQKDGTRKKRLYIIDAKSSSHVKISHQFQVTLYAIFLDHLLRVHHQDHLVEIDPQGGVWIPSCPEPKSFSLVFMRPIVESFIYRDLPAILQKPLAQAVWHIDSPCQQCEFLPQCKSDAKDQRTLSVIPTLSKKSALWIKSLFKRGSQQAEMDDIEDLVRGRTHLTPVYQSVLSKALQMDEQGQSALLSSYKSRALKVLPARTMELPLQHQERLLVNVLIDPMTFLPFGYALDIFKEQQLLSSRSITETVACGSDRLGSVANRQARLAGELIDTLHEWLVQIAEIKPRAPILSIFFYSQAMQIDLSTLLLKVASSPSSGVGTAVWTDLHRKRALDLLTNMYEDQSFLALSEGTEERFQLPDLLQLTQGFKNFAPLHDRRLFTIESALRKLVVLPVIGPYTFKDIMTHLVDVEAPGLIDERDRQDDRYNAEDLYKIWALQADPEQFKRAIHNWSEQQNVILIALYAVLKQDCGDLSALLLAPQAPFRMRPRFQMKHPVLARLAFFLQWETILQVERRRMRRVALSKEDSFRHQYVFQGRFLGRHIGPLPGRPMGTKPTKPLSNAPSSAYIGMFEITSRLNPGVLIGDDFPNWILSADNEVGHKERMRFDDTGALLRAFGKGSPAIVSMVHYDPEFNIAYVSGAYDNMTRAVGLIEGESYLLEPREYSPTLSTSMEKLQEMDRDCKLFLKLMADPNKWGQQRPAMSNDVFLESIGLPARHYDMTQSQEMAFARAIQNRLQVIWGPPGSGKTHFLALTILRCVDILRSLATKGKGQGPQTIVLTAFTHAAINNLVARVARLHGSIALRSGSESIVRPLILYRLGNPAVITIPGAKTVEPKDLAMQQRGVEDTKVDDDIVRVVAGTVWQIRRAANEKTGVEWMRKTQMLMIDEGSQLLAADAIHAIECLDPERGRLLVAGDHLQLGPVIMGNYPPSSQAMDPTGSIMRNLMRTVDNNPVSFRWVDGAPAVDIGPCTSQLQDNFRMNDQLGRFMKTIYGPRYVVQNPDKTLPFSGGLRGLSFPAKMRHILDPDRSAICIELQLTNDSQNPEAVKVRGDVRSAAYLEAVFVAGIVECYLAMVGPATSTSLFVAVPHHVQRLAILSRVQLPELQKKYPLATIMIDTIEKMQGQEADCVLVCFGLFDDSTLVNELAFLYSVHRWVVALSRARCKTILLMTPALKAPKIMGEAGKANAADLEGLDGWGLLQAFENYATELGGKIVWPIEEEFLEGIGMPST